jgi:hypothetical protein
MLLELDGRQRNDGHAVFAVDGEGVLALVVRGAAELEDLHRAAALFMLQAVAQQDHVVGHELLHAPASHVAIFLGALHRHQRGNPQSAQSRGNAVQFAAHGAGVGELREQRADGVQDHALGVDRVDGVLDARQQRRQVVGPDGQRVFAGLGRGVHHGDLLLVEQAFQVPAEGAHVLHQVGRRFFEGHEDTVLAIVAHPGEQELQCHHGLAAAGGARHQRAAPLGDAAVGDLVETDDARGQLGQFHRRVGRRHGWASLSSISRFRPSSTFSRSDRSPMILRIGSGRRLTRVGVARILSRSASSGCSSTSITSTS